MADIWKGAGIKPPAPARIAGWLGEWELEDLCSVLAECRDRGYLMSGPNYVHQVLTSAKRNGGRLLEHRGSGGYMDELKALNRAFTQAPVRASG